jgi:hypothetical protein
MDAVQEGTLYEFLHSAGKNGGELCAAFPAGSKGSKRAIPGEAQPVECQDSAEQIAFVFKRV